MLLKLLLKKVKILKSLKILKIMKRKGLGLEEETNDSMAKYAKHGRKLMAVAKKGKSSGKELFHRRYGNSDL